MDPGHDRFSWLDRLRCENERCLGVLRGFPIKREKAKQKSRANPLY
jgi:hypothetical protein